MLGICLLVCIAVALAEPGRNTVGIDKPMEEIKPKALPVWENEGKVIKENRFIKGKLKLIFKVLILLKILLLSFSVPIGVLSAKLMSWNAVGLSLLAFLTSTLVLTRSLFTSHRGPTGIHGPPPIIIQSSSDPVRKDRGVAMIYIQPGRLPAGEDESQRRKRWKIRQ